MNNLEQIAQIGKPKRRNLTAPKPRPEYKFIGHFDLDKVSDALKVQAYLNRNVYVTRLIDYSLVALYRKSYK